MDAAIIERLRAGVRGTVITPGDSRYEDARKVHNGMVDRYPAVIVRVANAGDVMFVMDLVGDAGLPGVNVAVRGGGHSAPGYGTCDGGVVIDLSGLRGVRVDPVAGTARVDGGATWGDLDAATYPFGLATTGGVVSTTGVTGLTLGGGIGYLARRYGLSCDNLLSADVVTPSGQFVVASESDHADLFWALRGGGGNFGVVTSCEFRLHPVKDVYGGLLLYEMAHAKDVLGFYREFIRDAPEELGMFAAFHLAPPLPFIPVERHGDPFVAFVVCWTGALVGGDRALQPLRDAAPVFVEHVGPMPYPVLNSLFDELASPGLNQYWKASFVTELTDEAIAAHLEHGPGVPSVSSVMHTYPINGACHRVASDATAFAYRDATFVTVIAGMWPDPADDEANIGWVRDYYAAIAPHSEAGGYVNFMSADDQGRVHDNYKGNYERLAEIKRRYDPDNVLHLNQNICP
ncbi:FAD-binding oxidoreductase [Flindersiella endophytica]